MTENWYRITLSTRIGQWACEPTCSPGDFTDSTGDSAFMKQVTKHNV